MRIGRLEDLLAIDELRGRVNLRLDALVPALEDGGGRVGDAVRYALLAPGKRIRPLLTLLAAAEFGAAVDDALDVACATEMVHAASLVLDDLPAMDDAGLRRGQPTTHRRFGQSTAILAAVALLNLAFATIARASHLAPDIRVALVARLADAVGFEGLVTGQDRDLNDRMHPATMARLETLNHQKTSVLFEAALEIGARVAGVGERRIDALREVAAHLGLAYQIADDLFDCADPPGAPLKDRNRDSGKPTVVSLIGIKGARERVGHHLGEALRLLPLRADGGAMLRPYIIITFGEAAAC